jgi:hypothetical protein
MKFIQRNRLSPYQDTMPSRMGKPGYCNRERRKEDETANRPMGDDRPVRFSRSFTLGFPRRLLFRIRDGSNIAYQKTAKFTHTTQSYIPAGGTQLVLI